MHSDSLLETTLRFCRQITSFRQSSLSTTTQGAKKDTEPSMRHQ